MTGAMEKSIDLILREIERSDNEKLRYKSDIMKDFITARFFDLDPNATSSRPTVNMSMNGFSPLWKSSPKFMVSSLKSYLKFSISISVTRNLSRKRAFVNDLAV